jgi:transposase
MRELGQRPTLGELQRATPWVWLWCERYRTILGRITKRGNRYLRMLFIQGARSILLRPTSWAKHSFGSWLAAAVRRLHRNVVAVALANKLARIAWTILAQGRRYEARVAPRVEPVTA